MSEIDYKGVVSLLGRLYQLRNNKDKIPQWRPFYLMNIGISSYTYYKLTPILQKYGIVKLDRSIDWSKVDEVIKQLEKTIKPKTS